MKRSALVALVAVAALGAWLASEVELSRQPSPDGAFVAVVTSSRLWSLVPAMPGQSRDRPGRLRIDRRDGRPCGSAPLDMAWQADDLRWADGSVRLPAIANWDLTACRVDVSGR